MMDDSCWSGGRHVTWTGVRVRRFAREEEGASTCSSCAAGKYSAEEDPHAHTFVNTATALCGPRGESAACLSPPDCGHDLLTVRCVGHAALGLELGVGERKEPLSRRDPRLDKAADLAVPMTRSGNKKVKTKRVAHPAVLLAAGALHTICAAVRTGRAAVLVRKSRTNASIVLLNFFNSFVTKGTFRQVRGKLSFHPPRDSPLPVLLPCAGQGERWPNAAWMKTRRSCAEACCGSAPRAGGGTPSACSLTPTARAPGTPPRRRRLTFHTGGRC